MQTRREKEEEQEKRYKAEQDQIKVGLVYSVNVNIYYLSFLLLLSLLMLIYTYCHLHHYTPLFIPYSPPIYSLFLPFSLYMYIAYEGVCGEVRSRQRQDGQTGNVYIYILYCTICTVLYTRTRYYTHITVYILYCILYYTHIILYTYYTIIYIYILTLLLLSPPSLPSRILNRPKAKRKPSTKCSSQALLTESSKSEY